MVGKGIWACSILTALAMSLAVSCKFLPLHLLINVPMEVALDPQQFPRRSAGAGIISIDLQSLNVAELSENQCLWPGVGLTVLENGAPLTRTRILDRVSTEPGLFTTRDHLLQVHPQSPASSLVVRFVPTASVRRLVKATALSCFALGALGLCILTYRFRTLRAPAPVRGILFAGIAICVGVQTFKGWNQVSYEGDSSSYIEDILRPPLYPAFIDAFGHAEKTASRKLSYVDSSEPDAPFVGVIHAQKVAFAACVAVFALVLASVLPAPLAVLYVFFVAFFNFLHWEWTNLILSESLALGFLLLVTASFLALCKRSSPTLLACLALSFSALLLTRSAGAFAIMLLATGLSVSFFNLRGQTAKRVFGYLCVAVIGGASLAWLLVHGHERHGIWALAPLKNYERIAFALQIADPADADLLTDDSARRFFRECLERRQEILRSQDLPDRIEKLTLNINVWEVAVPVASRLLGNVPDVLPQTDRLFDQVAGAVLPAHRDRYGKIVLHSLIYDGGWNATRIKAGPVSNLMLTAFGFLLCLLARNRWAGLGAVFLATHVANLVMVALVENIIYRYVFLSEWLFLLGMTFALWGVCQRLAKRVSPSSRAAFDPGLAHSVLAK